MSDQPSPAEASAANKPHDSARSVASGTPAWKATARRVAARKAADRRRQQAWVRERNARDADRAAAYQAERRRSDDEWTYAEMAELAQMMGVAFNGESVVVIPLKAQP